MTKKLIAEASADDQFYSQLGKIQAAIVKLEKLELLLTKHQTNMLEAASRDLLKLVDKR